MVGATLPSRVTRADGACEDYRPLVANRRLQSYRDNTDFRIAYERLGCLGIADINTTPRTRTSVLCQRTVR